MSNHCFKHGKHDGWRCPSCDIEATVQEEAEESRKSQIANNQTLIEAMEKSEQARTQALIEAQTRSTEEQVRAYQEAADRAEEAAEEAAERTEKTIREGIEEQERIARDSWKMEADSKVTSAIKLANTGLSDEALALVKEALSKDPTNIFGYLLLGSILWGKGNQQESVRSFSNALNLADDASLSARTFTNMLSWIPKDIDPQIIRMFRMLVKQVDPNESSGLSDLLKQLAMRGFHPEIEDILFRCLPAKTKKIFADSELPNDLYRSGAKKSVGMMTDAVASTIFPDEGDIWFSALCWSSTIDQECGWQHSEKVIAARERLSSKDAWKVLRIYADNRAVLKDRHPEVEKRVSSAIGLMVERVVSSISSTDAETWLSVLSWSVMIDRECGSKHFEKATLAGQKLIPDVGLKLLQCFAKERGNWENPEDLARVNGAVSETYSRMRDQIHQDFRTKSEATPYEEMKFSKAYLYGGLAIGFLYLIGSLIGSPQSSPIAHLFTAFGGGLALGWIPAIFIRLVANIMRKDNVRAAFLRKQWADEETLIKDCGLNINVTGDSVDESSRKS